MTYLVPFMSGSVQMFLLGTSMHECIICIVPFTHLLILAKCEVHAFLTRTISDLTIVWVVADWGVSMRHNYVSI